MYNKNLICLKDALIRKYKEQTYLSKTSFANGSQYLKVVEVNCKEKNTLKLMGEEVSFNSKE